MRRNSDYPQIIGLNETKIQFCVEVVKVDDRKVYVLPLTMLRIW